VSSGLASPLCNHNNLQAAAAAAVLRASGGPGAKDGVTEAARVRTFSGRVRVAA